MGSRSGILWYSIQRQVQHEMHHPWDEICRRNKCLQDDEQRWKNRYLYLPLLAAADDEDEDDGDGQVIVKY